MQRQSLPPGCGFTCSIFDGRYLLSAGVPWVSAEFSVTAQVGYSSCSRSVPRTTYGR